jgi:hypothetical protein
MAIKAKSDIFDRVIKTGQEMGIIEKRAKEMRVSGQINLAALPTERLKLLLQKRMQAFESLVKTGTLPAAFNKMLPPSTGVIDDDESEPESVMDSEFVEADS